MCSGVSACGKFDEDVSCTCECVVTFLCVKGMDLLRTNNINYVVNACPL